MALEALLDRCIADVAEGTDHEADPAAVVSREVVAAGGVVDRLHPGVATRSGLREDRVHGARAHALLAHRAEVAHPEMFVPFAPRFQGRQIGDVGVDRIDAQPSTLTGTDQQTMVANCTQTSEFGQVTSTTSCYPLRGRPVCCNASHRAPRPPYALVRLLAARPAT